MKLLRVLLAAMLAVVGVLAIAPVSEAAHHLVRIRQVYPGSVAFPSQEFVVLQLTSPGENLLTGTSVNFYNATGGQQNSATFSSNPPVGTNQATVLVATGNAESAFGQTADLNAGVGPNGIEGAGGAVCLFSPTFGNVNIDCVGWGNLTNAPTGVGTLEAAIPDGSRLERSIASGCSTFFETADDTDSSANDFAPQTTTAGMFTPRNNASAITETTCNLTVVKAGTGTGTITGTGINCGDGTPGDCTEGPYTGQNVVLTANATGGSNFENWTNCPMANMNQCTAPMTVSRTITANFDDDRLLTVTTSGTGDGNVTSAPVGINCDSDGTPNDCVASYANNTPVTLTATEAAGSDFAGWSGSGCSGTGTCMVTMDAAKSVDAQFVAEIPRTLTVATPTGNGTGTISGNGMSINCGTGGVPSDCSEIVPDGTMITLTATGTGGSSFDGFGGGCPASPNPCVITMDADKSVTSSFTAPPRMLTVTPPTGTGTGAITGTGINCGTAGSGAVDCTESYVQGAMVALTATPTGGSTFNGYSGDCTGAACTLSMTANRAVSGSFTAMAPPIIPSTPAAGPTGQRAAALKKCKKKKGRARRNCKKRANKLPI